MKPALPRPARRHERGFVATLLMVVIIVLLAGLTALNVSSVRRARREAALLETRHQRHWQKQPGIQLPPPEAPDAPASSTPTNSPPPRP